MKTLEEIEKIARVCHAVNKAYCESMGDMSQKDWDESPPWQLASAMKGVAMHLAHPESTPAASHIAWMLEKVEAGWIYGEKKDPDAIPPTHPCLVPFEQLPKEQQAKDFIFRAVVRALE